MNDKQYPMQKRLVCTPITKLLAKEIVERTTGLPEGAKCVDSFEDTWTRNVVLVWEHESFAEVPEGERIPDWPLMLKP